jgi:hypothetical protein
MVEST